MTKHFDHIPVKEPPLEAGIPNYEYCLYYIGTNNEFWNEIDDLFKIKTKIDDKNTIKEFKHSLLHYLAELIYETPPRKALASDKHMQMAELRSLCNSLDNIIDKYPLIKHATFEYFAKKNQTLNKGQNLSRGPSKANRITRKALGVMRDAAHKQLELTTQQEKPIDPTTINASLKYDLATYLCYAVDKIGSKPSGAPESFFDRLYKQCWKMVSHDNKEPCDRDKPLTNAIRDFKKSEKTA